jgi:hypothetical protein
MHVAEVGGAMGGSSSDARRRGLVGVETGVKSPREAVGVLGGSPSA